MKNTTSLLIFALITLYACYLSDELPEDQDVWGYSFPEERNTHQQTLLEIDSSVLAGEYGEINAVMVIKSGAIIFENYYENNEISRFRPNVKRAIGAATQIITIAALGLLVDDGIIPDIDAPIYPHLPDYFAVFDADTLKQDITFRHLISHTSGLAWNESVFAYQNINNDLNRMKTNTNWTQYILNKDLEALPGTRYALNTGNFIILSHVLSHLLGGTQQLTAFINERIFAPMQITDYAWDQDIAGNLDGGSGLSLTDVDFAKLGFLFLNRGRWNRSQLIDQLWLDQMLSIQRRINDSYSTGYGWWFLAEDRAEQLNLEETSIFFSPGYRGQSLFVVPSENLVVMIQGDNFFFGVQDDPGYQLFEKVLSATE